MNRNAYRETLDRVRDFNQKIERPALLLASLMAFNEVTQARVQELFNYEPLTGKLTNKQGTNVVVYGSLNAKFGSKKTLYVRLGLMRIAASRVIWLWVYGKHKKRVRLKDHKMGLILDNLFT